MKTKKYVVLMASVAFFTGLSTFAGTKHGGGGIGVQCGDQVKVLDLYESDEILQLPKGPEFPDFWSTYRFYNSKMAKYWDVFGEGTIGEEGDAYGLNYFLNHVEWSSYEISASEDAHLPTLKEGCRFVQIAYFDDIENKVQINGLLWWKLSYRDQVALLLHEIYYSEQRRLSTIELTSDEIRASVGRIFSDRDLTSVLYEHKSNPRIQHSTCFSKEHTFVASLIDRNGERGVILTFLAYYGRAKLERATAWIPVDGNRSSFSEMHLDSFTVKNDEGEILAQYTGLRVENNEVHLTRADGADVRMDCTH